MKEPRFMLRSRRLRNDRDSAPLTALAVLLAAVFMLPAVWLFANSLRPSTEIFKYVSPLSWRTLIPESPNFDNYVGLFEGAFGRAFLLSLIVTFITVAIGIVICITAAYALSVLDFPGRNFAFAFIVMSFMVPFEAIAIPLSQLFSTWGLTNTLMGLVLPAIGNGLAIFNLRQHFLSIPSSYREAATIDGASEIRVLQAVYVPLSGSAIVNSAVLIFLGQWTAYLWPLIAVSKTEFQLAPIVLAKSFGETNNDFGANFAGSILLSLVPALLMLVLQRSFGKLSFGSGEK